RIRDQMKAHHASSGEHTVRIVVKPRSNRAYLQAKQPHGIASEDPIAVLSRKPELANKGVRLGDVHRCIPVRSDDDPIRADEADEKTERLGVIRDRVVVESPEVLTKRPLQRKLLGCQAALDPSGNIGETAT